MSRTLKVIVVALSLLAVPILADASPKDHFNRARLRAEIRRSVRDSMRDARLARIHAARDVSWALARERRDMRRLADRIRQDLRRATRDLSRRYRWH
jgi:hypothetical protein